MQTVNPLTLTAKRRVSDIFDLTGNGIHHALRALAKKAKIKLTGLPRFHNIRKWVMNGLSRSEFNEFQIKYVLGKAIPMSDQVYLQTLELEIRERYPKAYSEFLNLSNRASKDLQEKTTKMEEENERLNKRVKQLETKSTDLTELQRQMNILKRQIEELAKTEKQQIASFFCDF